MTTMLFYVVLLQFVIQLVLYEAVKNAVLIPNKKLYKLVGKLRNYNNFIGKTVNYLFKNVHNESNLTKVIAFEFFVLNIAISTLVAAFSGAGMIVGIANLFASCLLGLVMTYDTYKTRCMVLQ